MALIKDYFEKTNKYIEEYGNKTIVLMQVGAFFEVYGLKKEIDTIHGSAIIDFSKTCDLNMVDKKVCVGNNRVMMAGFKELFLEKYIKKLQDAGFTAVVFVQDEQCANTTRSLAGIFSPGTYFSCDTDVITNNTCCIWIQMVDTQSKFFKKENGKRRVYVGVSCIDIYTGKTILFEFSEIYMHNPTTFDELERLISIYHPSETIIIGNVCKNDLESIVQFAHIKSNLIHYISLLDSSTNINVNVQRALRCEKQNYQKEVFEKFFIIADFNVFMNPFYDNCIATQSFCYLLDFIYQHNPYLIHKLQEPVFENIGDRLILANHSLKQLNIIDDGYHKGKYSSVISFLNQCVTSMGKRKFNNMFLNPTSKESYLTQEYDMIEYCLKQFHLYEPIKNHLGYISDITKIHRQIIIKKITPNHFYKIDVTLTHAISLFEIIKQEEPIMNYLKCNKEHLLEYIHELQTFLYTHVDISKCKDLDRPDATIIKSGINDELDSKILLMTDSEDKLRGIQTYFNMLLVQFEKPSKAKSRVKTKVQVDDEVLTEYIKIHETEKNNFNLIATERRCKILEEILLKNKQKDIKISYLSSITQKEEQFGFDTSTLDFFKQSKTEKYISSPQLSALYKNISSIKIELLDIVSKAYSQIVKRMDNYQKQFDIIADFIMTVDILFTKAYISNKYGYCKPKITFQNKSFVKIENLRHCLIENIQQSELYVANDIILGSQDISGQLLYGTNAVGKTSLIRALGIAVIMAQSGCFVPASAFEFYPFKSIFTRILGNDNLFKGLSTFAVEMSELRTILRLADKNSLVLGDELCSGTESISAISIFVTGVKKLYQLDSSFIFATHLHEIVNYTEITELNKLKISHMSVIYDKIRDLLIYDRKLKDGAGNNMYGLEVCKSLDLPQDFLEDANNLRMKYHPESASILDLKRSSYNTQFIKGMCEKCGKEFSSEVHHLQYQQDANDNGFIQTDSTYFHKNHSANLLNVCKKCHDEIHKTNTKHKKVKTSGGMKVVAV